MVVDEALRIWAIACSPGIACFAASAADPLRRLPPPVAACTTLLTIAVLIQATTLLDVLVLTIAAGLLAYLAASDLVHRTIPVWPCTVIFAIGAVICCASHGLLSASIRVGSGVFGALSFIAIDKVHRGWRGHGGLGSGDALMLAAIGPWFTPQALCLTVFLGSVISMMPVAAPGQLQRGFPLVMGLATAGAIIKLL